MNVLHAKLLKTGLQNVTKEDLEVKDEHRSGVPLDSVHMILEDQFGHFSRMDSEMLEC